jgi:hypothetical protein
MASTQLTSVQRVRLNPFCLPSDTSCRFALLIVTVLGASLFIYDALSLHQFNAKDYLSCLALEPSRQDMAENIVNPLEIRDPSALVDKSAAFSKCVIRAQRISSEWMLGGVAALSLVTLTIVWFLPAIKVRRGRLQPLSAEDAPEVVADLEKLSAEAGLRKRPQFLWNPLNPARTGLAFGRPGRPCVALAGGLVTQFYTDPAAFRAVLRHELAHIRNADVGKTYLAVASWYAFLVAALAPFFAAMDWGFYTPQIWRVLFLAFLVYLSRSAVLRIRENYADVRASQWDAEGALARVIAALPQVKESLWRSLWRLHPSPAERNRFLEQTENLFETGFWETLMAGLATGIAVPNVKLLLGALLIGSVQTGILASSVFAILIAGIVGTRIWRSSLAAFAGVAAEPRTARLGFALALGLVLGLQFSFSAAFDVQEQLPNRGLATFVWNGFLIAALLLASSLFVRWEKISASAWLGSTASARSPLIVYLVARVISAVFLAVILGSLYMVWEVGGTFLNTGLPGFASLLFTGIFVTLDQPAFTFLLVALWAFPLAAWFWQRSTASSAASWMFLDRPAVPLACRLQESLQPTLAVRIGLISGVVFLVLHLVIRLAWHFSLHGGDASDNGKMAMYYSQILLGSLVQMAAAAITATRVRPLPLLHGLLAAFTAGSIMAVGFLALNLAFGGSLAFKFASDVLQIFVNAGAFVTLVVVPPWVAIMRRVFRRNRPASAVARLTRAAN